MLRYIKITALFFFFRVVASGGKRRGDGSGLKYCTLMNVLTQQLADHTSLYIHPENVPCSE
jgi:hypothetical protein